MIAQSIASIEFTPTGAQVSGHPTLEQWAAAFDNALSLGSSASWSRGDLLFFAEDEQPYGDDYMNFVPESRVTEGTLRNDRRRIRRFPPSHDLRRFSTDLSTSHYDAVAPLTDVDAEIVLAQAASEQRGREWTRHRVKEILNTPDPNKASLTLVARTLTTGERVFVPTVNPPTWVTDGDAFDVTIKERKAA